MTILVPVPATAVQYSRHQVYFWSTETRAHEADSTGGEMHCERSLYFSTSNLISVGLGESRHKIRQVQQQQQQQQQQLQSEEDISLSTPIDRVSEAARSFELTRDVRVVKDSRDRRFNKR